MEYIIQKVYSRINVEIHKNNNTFEGKKSKKTKDWLEMKQISTVVKIFDTLNERKKTAIKRTHLKFNIQVNRIEL